MSHGNKKITRKILATNNKVLFCTGSLGFFKKYQQPMIRDSSNNLCHTLQILSVKQNSPFLFLTGKIKMDGVPTKNEKYPFYIVFEVLKVLLKIICKMQPLDHSFLVLDFTSANISLIFRASYNIYLKKNFCHKFSFLTDSPKPSHPLNGQNPLSVAKVFC